MVDIKWRDKEFERQVLIPEEVKLLNKIGARGEAVSKLLISQPGPLRAVDKGVLLNKTGFDPATPTSLVVRIGSNTKYAIHVFMGTVKMKARPVLRTMLHMLRSEFK
jgi:hypothetical protein